MKLTTRLTPAPYRRLRLGAPFDHPAIPAFEHFPALGQGIGTQGRQARLKGVGCRQLGQDGGHDLIVMPEGHHLVGNAEQADELAVAAQDLVPLVQGDDPLVRGFQDGAEQLQQVFGLQVCLLAFGRLAQVFLQPGLVPFQDGDQHGFQRRQFRRLPSFRRQGEITLNRRRPVTAPGQRPLQ